MLFEEEGMSDSSLRRLVSTSNFQAAGVLPVPILKRSRSDGEVSTQCVTELIRARWQIGVEHTHLVEKQLAMRFYDLKLMHTDELEHMRQFMQIARKKVQEHEYESMEQEITLNQDSQQQQLAFSEVQEKIQATSTLKVTEDFLRFVQERAQVLLGYNKKEAEDFKKLLSVFMIIKSPHKVMGDMKELESKLFLQAQELTDSLFNLAHYYSSELKEKENLSEKALLEAFFQQKKAFLFCFDMWSDRHVEELIQMLIGQYKSLGIKIAQLKYQTNTVMAQYPNLTAIDLLDAYQQKRELIKQELARLGDGKGIQQLNVEMDSLEREIEKEVIQGMSEAHFYHECIVDPGFYEKAFAYPDTVEKICEQIKIAFDSEPTSDFMGELFHEIQRRLNRLIPIFPRLQGCIDQQFNELIFSEIKRGYMPDIDAMQSCLFDVLSLLRDLDAPVNQELYDEYLELAQQDLAFVASIQNAFSQMTLFFFRRIEQIERFSYDLHQAMSFPQVKQLAITQERQAFQNDFSKSSLLNLQALQKQAFKSLSEEEKKHLFSQKGSHYLAKKVALQCVCSREKITFANFPETFHLDFGRLKEMQSHLYQIKQKLLCQIISESTLKAPLSESQRALSFSIIDQVFLKNPSENKREEALKKLYVYLPLILQKLSGQVFSQKSNDNIKLMAKVAMNPQSPLNRCLDERIDRAMHLFVEKKQWEKGFKSNRLHQVFLPELQRLAVNLCKLVSYNHEVHEATYQLRVKKLLEDEMLGQIKENKPVDVLACIPQGVSGRYERHRQKVHKFSSLFAGFILIKQLVFSHEKEVFCYQVSPEDFLGVFIEKNGLQLMQKDYRPTLEQVVKISMECVDRLFVEKEIDVAQDAKDDLVKKLYKIGAKQVAKNFMGQVVNECVQRQAHLNSSVITENKTQRSQKEVLEGFEGLLKLHLRNEGRDDDYLKNPNFEWICSIVVSAWETVFYYARNIENKSLLREEEFVAILAKNPQIKELVLDSCKGSKELYQALNRLTLDILNEKGICVEENEWSRFQKMLKKAVSLQSSGANLQLSHLQNLLKTALSKSLGAATFSSNRAHFIHLDYFQSEITDLCREFSYLCSRAWGISKVYEHDAKANFDFKIQTGIGNGSNTL